MREIHIFTSEGIEVIDTAPEAEIKVLNMEYLEERKEREKRRNLERRYKTWKLREKLKTKKIGLL